MSDKPRFTLEFRLRDNYGEFQPLCCAIDVDDALRISPRAVSELKMGADLGVSFVPPDEAVRMIRQRIMRRDLFMEAARRLVGQMADRMEDAEGWHDESRIEPARKALGGRWEP